MARYRDKSPEDLAWNRIRRNLTRDLDTEVMNRREEALNKLLSGAWDEFTRAIESGTVPELETKYQGFITGIVDDVVKAEELTRGPALD